MRDASGQPRRRDARLNHEAILAAAAHAWRAGGLDVGLVEVARRAEVGSATLYRHFGTREALVHAVYDERFAALAATTARAAARPDAWESLQLLLEGILEAGAGDRGLRQLLALGFGSAPLPLAEPAVIAGELRATVLRAAAAGVLRPGVSPDDVTVALFALGNVADLTEPVARGQWRRTLRVVLDGLRAHDDALPGRPMAGGEWDAILAPWVGRPLADALGG